MRMKKLYSITEQTYQIIKKLADEQQIPESYAVDNMAINYWRMTHKGQDFKPVYGSDEYWNQIAKESKK